MLSQVQTAPARTNGTHLAQGPSLSMHPRCRRVSRSLPQHLKLRIKVSPSRQESSPPGHLTSTCIPLVRQGSGQSLCSESSASSGISPNLESDTSSLLDRHSSISSGISPDFPSSYWTLLVAPPRQPLFILQLLKFKKDGIRFGFRVNKAKTAPRTGQVKVCGRRGRSHPIVYRVAAPALRS
ncbi:hypothetical protein BSL78_18503 [Apostichopus japonicus]|uniref:Uncharacterized protein n=1 Tax=Stichopus japonicus TaxID=307972 RepID=A0A2G8K9G7_STIJA|nr:hypothetical protein BSL78_18503 [Apostichopus japonicus]